MRKRFGSGSCLEIITGKGKYRMKKIMKVIAGISCIGAVIGAIMLLMNSKHRRWRTDERG